MSLIPMPSAARVSGFSLRPVAVTRAHASPFGAAESVVDLLQDRWVASFTSTPTTRAESAAVEAWLAAQRGGANTTSLHHLARPLPQGTLGRVHPVQGMVQDAPQGADAVQLVTTPGATLLAGDMLGVAGLLLQCAADCVADASGVITVPLANRLRRAVPGLRRASTATYVDAAGVLQTAAADVARYQGGQMLVEGAATNWLINSQDLSAASWSGTPSKTLATELYRGYAPFWAVAKTRAETSESLWSGGVLLTSGETIEYWIALLAGNVAQCAIGIYAADVWGLDAASAAAVVEGPGVVSRWDGSLFTITGLSTTVPTLVKVRRTLAVTSIAYGLTYPGGPESATIGHSVKLTRVELKTQIGDSTYIPTADAPATRAADVLPAVVLDRPSRPFRLASVPGVMHVPGYADGVSLEFVEDLSA